MRLRLSPELSDQTLSKIAEDRDGKVVGMLLVFKHHYGDYCIGPFYAEDLQTAETLLRELHRSVDVEVPLHGYIPSTNQRLRELLGTCGIDCELRGEPEIRMETKRGVVTDWSKVYAAFANTATLW